MILDRYALFCCRLVRPFANSYIEDDYVHYPGGYMACLFAQMYFLTWSIHQQNLLFV